MTRRILAALLLLAGTGAALADACDGPCSITMDYANGGTIVTSNGATITFSTGGVLDLGPTGSITLGTGGSLTPNVDPPDMSGGGSLVLGIGGSVTFDTGGSLDTGSAGNIALADSSDLDIAGAVDVSINSTQAVHLGTLNTAGAASVTAGGNIDGSNNSSAIHVDTSGSLNIVSDGDVTFASIAGATVELTDGSASTGPGFVDCSSGCPTGSQSTIGLPAIPTDSGTLGPYPQGSGGLGPLTLLPLLLAGLLRRR